MREQILKSLQEYYETHKRNPRYLVLPTTLARRFEREFIGAEIPCIAFGLVVVEDARAETAKLADA